MFNKRFTLKNKVMTITIKELFDGYKNNDPELNDGLGDDSVVGYSGKLSIRPAYQRAFVYSKPEQISVINTLSDGLGIGMLSWYKKEDGTYECLDGQQRTLSICSFLSNMFSVKIDGNSKNWDKIDLKDKEDFLNSKLYINVFYGGSEREKLEHFKTINIAGKSLKEQELLNSQYTGTWLYDAKMFFSRRKKMASAECENYIKAEVERQELLEKVLIGICENKNIDSISEYMSIHQNDLDASELKDYFKSVIKWIKTIFGKDKRVEMKSVNWFNLYNRFSDQIFDSTKIIKLVNELFQNEELEKKTGIYEYVLSGDQRVLTRRLFQENDKRTAYEKQNGICPICKNKFEFKGMHADHIIPWTEGGKTTLTNCQMLCVDCNLKKSSQYSKRID
ncbi:MAG: HNH endonuclease family protein [Mycoplasma sp.]